MVSVDVWTTQAALTGWGKANLRGLRPLGAAAASARLGQAFQIPGTTPALASKLAVWLATAGAPTDNVTLTLESSYGGLAAYAPPAQALVADGFTGTNGTSLQTYNPAWRQDSVGVVEIQSNQAQVRASSLGQATLYTVETGTVNQIVECDLIIPPTPGAGKDWFTGIVARYTDASSYIYGRILYQANSPEIELWDVVAGNGTLLLHNAMPPGTYVPGSVHRLRLVVNGASASLYLDTALTVNANSPTTPAGWVTGTTSVLTGTRAGLVQSAPTDQLGIWDTFSVAASDIAAVATPLAAGALAGNGAYTLFSFPSPVLLLPNVTYWITLGRSGSLDGNNHYLVGVDTAAGYASAAPANAARWDNTSVVNGTTRTAAPYWTALTESLIFAVYGPGATVPVLP